MDLLRKRMSEMSDKDYDDEAYAKATNMTHKDNASGHGSDLYKLPNHPTFSQDSLASNPLQSGGVWSEGNGGWRDMGASKLDDTSFTPSEHNLRNMSPEDLQRYFNAVEVKVNEKGEPMNRTYDTGYGKVDVPDVVPLNLPNRMKMSRFTKLKDKLK